MSEFNIADDRGRPSWYIRRRIIISTLIFCAICVSYILYFYPESDSRLLETIIVSAFTLGGTTIGSYVFGAAWTDVKIDSRSNKNPVSYEQSAAKQASQDER